MVSNPMQRKSRNSFILGLILGLFFMGAIAAFLVYQLKVMKEAENARIAKEKLVWVLSSDVKSGDEVNAGLFKQVSVTSDSIPADAMNTSSLPEDAIAKIDLKKGVILSQGLVQSAGQKMTDDLRVQEYNMIRLNAGTQSGDSIDVRLRLPNGLDYIVLSKKKVEIPEVGGVLNDRTIWLKLTEEETLIMSEAIVESYMIEGSMLYTTNYVEPGLQKEVIPTYIPSNATRNLINDNKNIVNEAKQKLAEIYESDRIGTRGKIEAEINKDPTGAENRAKSGTNTEITDAKTLRKSYLDALAGN